MRNVIKWLFMIVIFINLVGNSQANSQFRLRVGYLPILDHLVLLASYTQDNEQFKGLTVELKLFRAWDEIVGALKADVIDAAFILSPLAMNLFNEGVAIKTVLLAHRNGSAITVKKDSLITSPTGLKGKIIAIPHQKSTHTALLNHYLMRDNLSLADITTRVIAPPDMIQAMKLGKIEAFIVAEPFGSKAQSEGIGKILVLTKDIIDHHVDCIVVVKQSILENQQLALQEWVNSLVRAGSWIEKDRRDNGSRQIAQMVAKKYLPHNEEVIVNGLENPVDRIIFTDLSPTLADFQTIVDLATQAHLIERVDLESFIDARFTIQKE